MTKKVRITSIHKDAWGGLKQLKVGDVVSCVTDTSQWLGLQLERKIAELQWEDTAGKVLSWTIFSDHYSEGENYVEFEDVGEELAPEEEEQLKERDILNIPIYSFEEFRQQYLEVVEREIALHSDTITAQEIIAGDYLPLRDENDIHILVGTAAHWDMDMFRVSKSIVAIDCTDHYVIISGTDALIQLK